MAERFTGANHEPAMRCQGDAMRKILKTDDGSPPLIQYRRLVVTGK